MSTPTTTEPPQTEYLRIAAIGLILGLFGSGVILKLLLAYLAKDTTQLDSTINLLVGFVSAVLLYLGIRIGQNSG